MTGSTRTPSRTRRKSRESPVHRKDARRVWREAARKRPGFTQREHGTSPGSPPYTTCPRTRPPPSAAGQSGRTSSCASRLRTRPGPIRSRRISGHSAPSSWATPTTRTTPRWRAGCRATCAGVMPTPAIPTCWPPSAANAPASAANASNAGAARNLKPHDRPGERSWPAH